MKKITGREMRKLIAAVTVMMLALVIAVIAYFMVDSIMTTNSNIEKNKEMVVDKTVITLRDVGGKVTSLSTDPQFIKYFDQETVQEIMKGDTAALYKLAVAFAIAVNPLEYAGVVEDGKVVDYRTQSGVVVNPAELPVEPPESDYQTLDSFGGRQGFFVSLFYPVDLSSYGFKSFYLNVIIDRTTEMQEIQDYFVKQRNDMIIRLSIVSVIAVILSILLTTLGLRYFTNKYVTEPVEKLNRMAGEIADGTFEGEVKVDRKSAYAALQGLLRSGQLILSKMDKDLNE